MKNNFLPIVLKLFTFTGLIALGYQNLAQAESQFSLNPRPRIATETTDKLAQVDQVGNLVEVAQEDEELSTFAAAVEEAELTDSLANENDSYTVFAPTNEAFESLPAGTLDELKKPENQPLLREILAYHVAEGATTSDQLSTGAVQTLGGGLAVRVDSNKVIVNDANVTTANVKASNGVIHKVNRILLTRELRTRVLALTQPRPVRALW